MVVYPEGTWYSGLTPEVIPEIVCEHFLADRPVERLVNVDASALREEIEANKARRLSALKALDEAGELPDDFLQRVRAFQESRVLLTAIELDVFSSLGDGATAAEVAGRLETDVRATEMLLNALVALQLLEKEDGVFRNGQLAARYLTEGAPDDSRSGLMHSAHLWQRWSTLTDCVKKGTSVTYTPMEERKERWTQAFIAAMHKNALARAPQVVAAVGAEGISRMLDVGGGSGAYAMAFIRANGNIRAEVLDLPSVIPLAGRYVEDAGLAGKVALRAGDMHTDDFGDGYDLILMSAICHMNSPQQNRELFAKSFNALVPGGRFVIQDFILGPDKTSPRTAALFALNMLVGTRAGNSYSDREYFTWLEEAGFQEIRHIQLPGPTGLIVGTRS